jgi:hypothetical protein
MTEASVNKFRDSISRIRRLDEIKTLFTQEELDKLAECWSPAAQARMDVDERVEGLLINMFAYFVEIGQGEEFDRYTFMSDMEDQGLTPTGCGTILDFSVKNGVLIKSDDADPQYCVDDDVYDHMDRLVGGSER